MLDRQTQHSTREICWLSSVIDCDELHALETKMQEFYGTDVRDPYQAMLDQQSDDAFCSDGPSKALLDETLGCSPGSIVEVGCSNGRIFRALRARGYRGSYVGADVSPKITSANASRYRDGKFVCCTAYDLPLEDGSIDCYISMYVLEHLVFPRRAIDEALRVVRPGGSIIMLFPDFVMSGRFCSQWRGSAFGTFSEKIRGGRIFDAALTLIDSRIRIPLALRNAERRKGEFLVNTQPACLNFSGAPIPDYDAVYIASKDEVIHTI